MNNNNNLHSFMKDLKLNVKWTLILNYKIWIKYVNVIFSYAFSLHFCKFNLYIYRSNCML